MTLVGIFGRQVAKEIAVASLVALAGGLALFVAVDFVETSNQATADAALESVLRLELASLPLVALQIGQLAAAVGAAAATASLLRRNEIVAMLAAGAHPRILLWPAILAGAVFAGLHAAVTEWVAPAARAEILALRAELGLPVKSREQLEKRQTWFRGEGRLLRVQEIVDRDGTILSGVLILAISEGHLEERIDLARLEHDGHGWIGRDVVRRRFSGGELSTSRAEEAPIDVAETPRDFIRIIGSPDRMTYAALADAIGARERLGHSAAEHRLELYRRHAAPLELVLALVLSVAMILRTSRRPSMAVALAAGAGIGFGLWLFGEVSLALGSTAALTPEVAAHGGTALAAAAAAFAWIVAFRRGVAD